PGSGPVQWARGPPAGPQGRPDVREPARDPRLVRELDEPDMPRGATSQCPTPGRGFRGALEPCGLAGAFGHVLGKESHTFVTMSDTGTWLARRCLLRTSAVARAGVRHSVARSARPRGG